MEGVRIQGFRGDLLLNRRGEWGQNLPPEFTSVKEERVTWDARSHPTKRTADDREEPVSKKPKVAHGGAGGEGNWDTQGQGQDARGEDPGVEEEDSHSGGRNQAFGRSRDLGKSSSSRGTQGAKLSLGTKNIITNYFGVDNWAGLREGVEGQGVTAVPRNQKPETRK